MTADSGPVCRTRCRVCYADTDAMGIVYYARYLRWFEMGRTEWLRQQGIPYQEMETRGIWLPVSEVNCNYMSPARYDEPLTIETRLDPSMRAGLRFDYRILRDDASDPLAVGFTRHAFIDRNHKVIRPPLWLRNQLPATGPPR